MTVFLTPDQVPFYGGTYFPPEERHGIPGFPRVLLSVAQAYRERRAEIGKDAAAIMHELQSDIQLPPATGELTPDILDKAASSLMSDYDLQDGGFGTAPKFPPAMPLDFLLRSFARTGARRFLEAVEQTLQKMASGGIYDQLGGGFHRYSVDSHWLVPHFEKMLYDNALLSRIYLHAFLLTGNLLYRRVVEETLGYVLREMTSPEGGFHATQDADSEGEEGRFYTWERREVEDRLGSEDAELFCRYYGITAEGSLGGRNVLHIPRPASLVARLNGISEPELWNRVEHGKRALLAMRADRIRPARDEKILVAWNGLMLKSFAEAAQGLDREDFRAAAVRCAEFLLSRLEQGGRLLHSYKDGQARIPAFLDDYACLVDGLLSLYESTFEPRWLQEATRLAAITVDKFQDRAGAGFFMSSGEHGDLIQRPKEFYDHAQPSGNSAAAHALLRLAKFTRDESWSHPALSLLKALAEVMARHPATFGHLACALDFALSGALEIAIAGDPREEATRTLLREVFHRYLPNKIVVCGDGSELFLLREHVQVSGLPTARICSSHVYQAPVTSAAELASQLKALMPQSIP